MGVAPEARRPGRAPEEPTTRQSPPPLPGFPSTLPCPATSRRGLRTLPGARPVAWTRDGSIPAAEDGGLARGSRGSLTSRTAPR